MKKSLLATTAIAAVAVVGVASSAAAEGFEAKINGYMEQYFGYSDSSNAAVSRADQFAQNSDAEFYVSGKQTLDNGLTVGFQIEVEGEVAGIDEQYAYIEGGFGKLIAGAENPAGYLMHLAVKSNGVGVEENDGTNVWIAGSAGGAAARTNMHSGAIDDRNTITYLSPKVNGIQIGASYTPTMTTDAIQPGGTTGTQRRNDGVRDDGWSLGASYAGAFTGDVSVKLSAGYTDGGQDDAVAGDLTVFTAGIQVGFGGFTVSGAYGSENDDAAGEDYNNFAASLAYNAGPMGVSAVYLTSKDDQGNDKQDQFELGASYAMGPGVKAQASIYVAERTDGGNKAADGVAAVAGIRLDF
jgi:outer membrane protein OmpU